MGFEGGNDNEAETQVIAVADLLTVSGLSIPKDKYIFVVVQWRTEQITSFDTVNLALRLNTTLLQDQRLPVNFGNVEESNILTWWVGPREAAYLVAQNWSSGGSRAIAGGGFNVAPDQASGATELNLGRQALSFRNGAAPDEVITSVTVTGSVDSNNICKLLVRNLRVHTLPTS